MFEQDPRILKMVQNSTEVINDGWKALSAARRTSGVYLAEKEIFFAGASFLFDAVMHAMSPDKEPTEADLAVMDKLHRELQQFNSGFNSKILRGPSR